MRLILARHGNTFGPGDKICWVGSRNDLPLVESGLNQARAAAAALADVSLSAIYCAPLKRTREFAQIVAQAQRSNVDVRIDERLTELDYGEWSGLTDDEIKETFGSQSLSDWVEKSIFPQNCGWPSRERIIEEVRDFAEHVKATHPPEANILAVSSNGRLRFFAKLVAGEFEKRQAEKSLKVGTGQLGILELNSDPQANCLRLWNSQPEALKAALAGSSSSASCTSATRDSK
jgi:broad specificity phosphatase PhoE